MMAWATGTSMHWDDLDASFATPLVLLMRLASTAWFPSQEEPLTVGVVPIRIPSRTRLSIRTTVST